VTGTSTDVVISGAGVGGLACAHALHRLGFTVTVCERRAEPADVAKGELLQPEGVAILDRWGVLPALRAAGAVAVDRLAIRDPAGAPLMTLDYRALPGEHRQILCADYTTVLRVLADTLDPAVTVRRGVTVDGPLRDGTGRVAGVRIRDHGTVEEIPARLVVAADGLSSPLRKEAGVTARRRAYDHRLVAIDVPGVEVAPEVTAYLHEAGLRLLYPLPGRRARLYVQVAADEMRGVDIDAWCTRLLAELPALAPHAAAIRAALDTRQVLAIGRLRNPQLTVPGMAMVGEAAHTVHPMAAQGMNSSLADAAALAARIAERPGRSAADLDAALLAHQAHRLPRLDHTATVSHNAARMLTVTTGLGKRLGRRMMRNTAANARLRQITAGNLAGTLVRPLRPLDRLYQLGLRRDRRADVLEHGSPTPVAP
jgi:2-polyprenyl-6-methoxyphenol hydroxylase-like FAD-dependent oxidoreductase